jgi:integrase
MSLIRRGRIWWVDITASGRRIKKSTGQTDKAIAKKIYNKILGQIADEKWFERLPGEEKTLKELLEKYMTEYSARNKSPNSHLRDKSLKAHLLGHLGDYTLTKITPKLVSGYKTKRREEGASPRTVNYELTLLGHAFNLAIKEWEWVRENPAAKVSKEKVNNLRERWLTLEEEDRLLKVSPKWLQEMIVFAINTGLRQDELLGLQWPQIDLFKKTMTILEQKNKGKDTLPLNGKAMEVLKNRAKVRSIGSNSVFYSASKTLITAGNLRRAFYSATEKAGIHGLWWHDLRHTFATRLVQAGVDIYTVQKLGRWRNISMVMRYAHHYPESLRVGIGALDRFAEGKGTNREQQPHCEESAQKSI